MTIYDEVRNGNISVFEGGQVNLSALRDLQESLPNGISVAGAAAGEFDVFSAGIFGLGIEATQGVFVDTRQNHTNFSAGALFADVSTFPSPVEVGFELFFVNSDFEDFSGSATALEVGLFGGFGITVPTPELGQVPQLVSDLANQTNSFSEFVENFLEMAPPGSAIYPSVGGWGLGLEQQYTFQTPGFDWEGSLTVIGEGMIGPGAAGHFSHCFLEDSTVQMWPLDPSIKPRLDGSYDEQLVLSKVWYKRQDQMQVGDVVASYDKWGRLQPGRVTRTMTNTATHILDFWGTGVTPGHAYNCADGPLKGGFAPIMDILRMDGALMRSDGTMFRSTTNCDVGSIGDRMIHAEAIIQNPDGSWTPKKRGQIRFGTRISTPDGKKSVSVMELAERQGWKLSDDGYMVGKIEGEDGTVQEGKFPFPYTHGAELPKPEDYILTRSQVTLEEIYFANEWEQIGTRLSAPDGLAEFVSPNRGHVPSPNLPHAFVDRPDAPIELGALFGFDSAVTSRTSHDIGAGASVHSSGTLMPTVARSGWKTYNFEVAEHHTYIADGIRVHNESTVYTLREDGTVAHLQDGDGNYIHVADHLNYTPLQLEHYGRIGVDEHGNQYVETEGFFQSVGTFFRAMGDIIGLDGTLGMDGGFEHTGQRIDTSGGYHEQGVDPNENEDNSNVGKWFEDRDDDKVPNILDFNDGVGWLDTAKQKPLIFDLDDDGIEISAGLQTFFDIDGDGYQEATSWVGGDDGFLVIDLNADGTQGAGDGVIDQGQEVAFALWGNADDTDLQALRRIFDENGDNILDSQDGVWSQLRIWQDFDQDGRTFDDQNGNGTLDPGEEDRNADGDLELRTLSQMGITSINLFYDGVDVATDDIDASFADEGNDVTVFDNTLLGQASFSHDGSVIIDSEGDGVGTLGDVSLNSRDLGWRQITTDFGHEVQFESGEKWRYAVLENDVSTSANVDLDALVLDGATGDDRDNFLNASFHTREVQISGGAGNDSVWGGNNDDMLSGDSGIDDIRGQGGNDTLFVDAADLANGSVSGNEGVDTLIISGDIGAYVMLLNHEVEAVFGGGGNDTLSGVGLWDDLPIFGGAGDDVITGGEANDRLSGDGGADQINAGHGGDFVFGGTHEDTLFGEAGDDFVSGGEDSDHINGGNGDDTLIGDTGNDTLFGEKADDVLDGGLGDDDLHGGYGDNTLRGGDGNDSLSFWFGENVLEGGDGDDHFYLQPDHQTIVTGLAYSRSTVFGGTGIDSFYFSKNSADDLEHIQGNQWQLHDGHTGHAAQAVVIDLIDIEQIVWSDGSITTLGTDDSADTSDSYQRTIKVDFNYGTGEELADDFISGSMGSEFTNLGNDSVSGGYASNLFSLGGGNDTAQGRGGHDTLNGESGLDQLAGGNGDDSITGHSGADIMSGGDGFDTLYGHAGADRMWGDADNDQMYGGSGSDTINGGTGNDELHGGDSADLLRGSHGGDTLFGGSGADTLNGNEGMDLLWGQMGADSITGGSGNDTLHGQDGFDYLQGDFGDDELYGGDDDDELSGGDGADGIYGGNGRDRLNGGAGADTLDGGAGLLDAANYVDSDAAVVINLSVGSASGGHAENDTILNIENLFGSKHSDNLTGDASDNTIEGHDGEDTINGGAGSDWLHGGLQYDSIDAGDGDDRVWGGNGKDMVSLGAGDDAFYDHEQNDEHGHDTVSGGHGDDEIFGSGGNDSFSGNAGHDTIFGGIGNDFLEGGSGMDSLEGGDGGDSINGGEGADILIGGYGEDQINGGIGADYIDGGSQADNIIAGEGNDTVFGGLGGDYVNLHDGNDLFEDDVQFNEYGNDTVDGGLGNDTILGRGGNDVFQGDEGDDLIYGGLGDDTLNGGDGADILDGMEGDDLLYGGAGNDTLLGHAGNDLLKGNAGTDIFVFADGFGNDTVSDFSLNNLEKIDLSAVTGIVGFNDLLNNHLEEDVSGNAVIRVGSDTITLTGISEAAIRLEVDFTATDFVF